MEYLQFTTEIVDLSIKIADLVVEKPIKQIPNQIGSISVEKMPFRIVLKILLLFFIQNGINCWNRAFEIYWSWLVLHLHWYICPLNSFHFQWKTHLEIVFH